MAQINFILQGKGGVGKSYISSLLAQYYIAAGRTTANFDTDPINASFGSFKALDVNVIGIMDGDVINTRHFDELIDMLLALPEGAEAVVDNGASTFAPLSSYMADNGVSNFLQGRGHTIRIHTVVTGGPPQDATFEGLTTLFKNLNLPVTVWVNPFFGRIDFLNESIYEENKHRIEAVIALPHNKRETFGLDIEYMLSKKLTFDEVIKDERFSNMACQRLMMLKEEIFKLMEEAEF